MCVQFKHMLKLPKSICNKCQNLMDCLIVFLNVPTVNTADLSCGIVLFFQKKVTFLVCEQLVEIRCQLSLCFRKQSFKGKTSPYYREDLQYK